MIELILINLATCLLHFRSTLVIPSIVYYSRPVSSRVCNHPQRYTRVYLLLCPIEIRFKLFTTKMYQVARECALSSFNVSTCLLGHSSPSHTSNHVRFANANFPATFPRNCEVVSDLLAARCTHFQSLGHEGRVSPAPRHNNYYGAYL